MLLISKVIEGRTSLTLELSYCLEWHKKKELEKSKINLIDDAVQQVQEEFEWL